MSCYLYILKSEVKDTYYTGVSANPELRLQFHNSDSQGYTQRYRPWEMIYTQKFETKETAMKAEKKVKSWKSKNMIRLLAKGKIAIEDYL